ncbi:phosphotransferase family protein [Micromonospora sp. NPDC005087]|uniref:phosphotransferase family protein n=1 Tax=Micromonospora sp. NPDC005087 TaxID=3364225 RepID=UPI00367ABFF4
MTAGPPGLDLDRLAEHLRRHAPGLLAGPLRATVIAGGKSNITYEVTSGGQAFIVRRPPLGHVLATAHDMGREYRVLTALGPTAVPVPRTELFCGDESVLGAPFYVMAKVAGTAYRDAADLARLGPDRTRHINGRMVDTLAALHAVDPAAVGLADLGRPDGYLARQLRTWRRQSDATPSSDPEPVRALHTQLVARLPAEAAHTAVHGDYRLDNLLVDDAGEIAAVVDWEMATLGDPFTDLALLLAYRRLADLDTRRAIGDAAAAPGAFTPVEICERYATASGCDLPDLGFYLGLAYLKLAVVLEGIAYRFCQGHTVGDGFEHIGGLVSGLLDGGREALASKRSPL